MRILIGLSILQTAAIIVLFAFLLNDRDRALPQQASDANVGNREKFTASGDDSTSLSRSLDEQRLRAVIREELAAQRKSDAASVRDASAKTDADARSALHAREQRDRVTQAIESYKSVGSINDQQMQELLDSIGQLDEQSRRQAMSSLIGALNTGALKGRLQ